MNFPNALENTLVFEGGYVDNPNDPGKATNHGITQHTYDLYRQNLGLPPESVKFITAQEVSTIYHDSFWAAIQADRLPFGVDAMVFDAAVNLGALEASKLLQEALCVTVDGVIGSETLIAATKISPINLCKSYTLLRVKFYIGLVLLRPSSIMFLEGWILRALSFYG